MSLALLNHPIVKPIMAATELNTTSGEDDDDSTASNALLQRQLALQELRILTRELAKKTNRRLQNARRLYIGSIEQLAMQGSTRGNLQDGSSRNALTIAMRNNHGLGFHRKASESSDEASSSCSVDRCQSDALAGISHNNNLAAPHLNQRHPANEKTQHHPLPLSFRCCRQKPQQQKCRLSEPPCQHEKNMTLQRLEQKHYCQKLQQESQMPYQGRHTPQQHHERNYHLQQELQKPLQHKLATQTQPDKNYPQLEQRQQDHPHRLKQGQHRQPQEPSQQQYKYQHKRVNPQRNQENPSKFYSDGKQLIIPPKLAGTTLNTRLSKQSTEKTLHTQSLWNATDKALYSEPPLSLTEKTLQTSLQLPLEIQHGSNHGISRRYSRDFKEQQNNDSDDEIRSGNFFSMDSLSEASDDSSDLMLIQPTAPESRWSPSMSLAGPTDWQPLESFPTRVSTSTCATAAAAGPVISNSNDEKDATLQGEPAMSGDVAELDWDALCKDSARFPETPRQEERPNKEVLFRVKIQRPMAEINMLSSNSEHPVAEAVDLDVPTKGDAELVRTSSGRAESLNRQPQMIELNPINQEMLHKIRTCSSNYSTGRRSQSGMDTSHASTSLNIDAGATVSCRPGSLPGINIDTVSAVRNEDMAEEEAITCPSTCDPINRSGKKRVSFSKPVNLADGGKSCVVPAYEFEQDSTALNVSTDNNISEIISPPKDNLQSNQLNSQANCSFNTSSNSGIRLEEHRRTVKISARTEHTLSSNGFYGDLKESPLDFGAHIGGSNCANSSYSRQDQRRKFKRGRCHNQITFSLSGVEQYQMISTASNTSSPASNSYCIPIYAPQYQECGSVEQPSPEVSGPSASEITPTIQNASPPDLPADSDDNIDFSWVTNLDKDVSDALFQQPSSHRISSGLGTADTSCKVKLNQLTTASGSLTSMHLTDPSTEKLNSFSCSDNCVNPSDVRDSAMVTSRAECVTRSVSKNLIRSFDSLESDNTLVSTSFQEQKTVIGYEDMQSSEITSPTLTSKTPPVAAVVDLLACADTSVEGAHLTRALVRGLVCNVESLRSALSAAVMLLKDRGCTGTLAQAMGTADTLDELIRDLQKISKQQQPLLQKRPHRTSRQKNRQSRRSRSLSETSAEGDSEKTPTNTAATPRSRSTQWSASFHAGTTDSIQCHAMAHYVIGEQVVEPTLERNESLECRPSTIRLMGANSKAVHLATDTRIRKR